MSAVTSRPTQSRPTQSRPTQSMPTTARLALSRQRPLRVVRGWPIGLAEAMLVGLNASVTVALRRLFDSWDFVGPALVALLASHLLAWSMRRARLGLAVSVATSVVVMVFFIANVRFGATTSFGVPTADTWSALGDQMGVAWDEFAVVKAPAPALDGFVVALMAVLWVAAVIADTAAFRTRTVLEAVLPATTIFVFTALLGVTSWRAVTTGAFIATAGLFLLASRIAFPLSLAVPVGRVRSKQPSAHLRSGLIIVGVAMLLGVAAGPLIPGVGNAAVIDWKSLDGSGGTRVTLSPLVDARGRLVQQSDVELFRVTTSLDTGAYWRITALDQYTNGVWTSSYQYSDARGTLSVPDSDNGVVIDAEFTVANLGDIWLPAPYEAVSISGIAASWDNESSSLVTPDPTTDGTAYSVRSIVPTFSPADLRAASGVIPDDIRLRYTALPVTVSERVTTLAAELTAGLGSNYDRALALQQFFRDNFTYSTDVSAGHDGDRVERFVFDERIGYCEQFAGTFAVMARSVGLPTRVATGFTPGQRFGDQFVVRGENYHAWPEVWIDGAWVSFEPTPGRGSPQGVAWTGVAPAQEGGFSSGNTEEEEFNNGGQLVLPSTTLDIESQLPDLEADTSTTTGVVDGSGGALGWLAPMFAMLGGFGLVAAGWWFGVPALARRRHHRRHAAAETNRARIHELWRDITLAFAVHGRPMGTTETRSEFVARAAADGWVSTNDLARIATLTDAAQFGASAPADAEVTEARVIAAAIVAQLDSRGDRSDQIKRRIDPRVLVG